jgi:hypothetical protein
MYCTKEFYNELSEKEVIIADNRVNMRDDSTKYGYDYLFNKMNINNGNGMFFAWTNYDYKGNINFKEEETDFKLLKLDVDEYIKTDYENWCSFCMDLDDCDGNLEEADAYCKEELGIEDGIVGSYNAIFDIDDNNEVQLLLPKVSASDIISVRNVNRKYV